MKSFAVGFTGVANGKFEPEFRAPSNYKDATKIANYIEDSRKEYIQTCSRVPYCSVPSRIVLVDSGSNVVGTWEPGKATSEAQLCEELLKFYTHWQLTVNMEGNLVFGFDIEQLLMSVAVILITNKPVVDPRFWLDVRCDARDMYKTVTSGVVRQWLDLQDVCNYFGYPDAEVLNTAYGQAGAALHLGKMVFNV